MNLDRLADGDLHTLADFVELYCLLTLDRIASVDDVDDYAFDVLDRARDSLPLADAWRQLAWRQRAFGAAYPFAVDVAEGTLEVLANLSEIQTGYVWLLLCSSLPYVEATHRKPLTDGFERVSHAALRHTFFPPAQVKLFGKATSAYAGQSKSERMAQLGKDLGGRPRIGPDTFRPHDSGDGGIDIVVWRSLDNEHAENQITALAQCACSRDKWESKQVEMSASRLTKILYPTTPWVEVMCIPFCFRDNTGTWAVDSAVNSVVLFDRLRLVNALDVEDWRALSTDFTVADDLLAERLDSV